MNGFERTGRAKKASIIFSYVPAAAFQREADDMANTMASWDQAQRDRWAAAAGANSPSELTWALVVEKVRGQIADRALEEEALGTADGCIS